MASHVSNAGAVKREPMTALHHCRGAGRAAPHVDKPREGMVQRPASMRLASAERSRPRAPSAARLNAITTAILSRGIDPRYPLDPGGSMSTWPQRLAASGRGAGRLERGAVEDVVLGDLDLLEAEGAHHLDQDHDAGDDRRRPSRMQAGDLEPLLERL